MKTEQQGIWAKVLRPSDWSWKNAEALAFFFLLSLVLYKPSAVGLGGERLGFVLVTAAALSLLAIKVVLRKVVPAYFGKLLAFAIVMSMAMQATAFVNYAYLDFRNYIDVFKPLLFFVFIYVGYAYAAKVSDQSLFRFYLAFLAIQLVVCIAEKFFAGLFQPILLNLWNISKGGTIRVTGTMTNPNALGLFVVTAFFSCLIYVKSGTAKLALTVAALVTILLASSRSSVFLLVAGALFYAFVNRRKGASTMRLIAGITIVALVGFAVIIGLQDFIKREFRYMGELYKIVEGGPQMLFEVSTFKKRMVAWTNALRIFFAQSQFVALVGMGPRKAEYHSLDNEYLFVLLRYGLVGIVLQVVLFVSILATTVVNRMKAVYMAKLIFLNYCMLIVMGLVSESFSMWLVLQHLGLLYGAFLRSSSRPMLYEGEV